MESFSRLFRDFRYAFRSLRRSPAMATAAIATLALGIGANTAIFSVLEGVVLEPLPFPQPDRLVIVALFNRSLGYATYLSYPDFLDWQRNASSFEQIAAFTNDGFDLTAPGVPEHLGRQRGIREFLQYSGRATGFRAQLFTRRRQDRRRTRGRHQQSNSTRTLCRRPCSFG